MNINPEDYLNLNKELWDNKVDDHVASAFYDVPSFLDGKTSLRTIELELLPDLNGKSLLHLQCHFGLDTMSLGRLGAKSTGLDFSQIAIDQARELAQETNSVSEFVCTDVYSAQEVLNRQFDYVYTSYGTIGWLPDIRKWAQVVSNSLVHGGEFMIVDFHPVMWMFDDDFKEITYAYRNGDAITGIETKTYTDSDKEYNSPWVSWNWGLSDIIQSLLDCGLQITHLSEYDFSPYECFPNMNKDGDQEYRFKNLGGKIPMVYAIKAVKPS